LTFLAFVLTLFVFNKFTSFVEGRPGANLVDPVLSLFPPTKMTWFTFLLIYGSIVMAVFDLKRAPEQFLFGVQAYICLIMVRMLAMYLTPLDPPVGMILLRDPIVEFFASDRQLTRDLFFSGHTATLFLLFLVTPSKKLKIFFLASTIVVAFCLLLQHVHYSTDIVSAPFFSYSCYRMIGVLRKRYFKALA